MASGARSPSDSRSRIAAVLALGAVLALTGCETVSGPLPSGKEPALSSAPDPAPAREQTAALVVPPVLDDDPRQLMGLGPERLEALLGAPGLIRREGEAAIWQYRDGTCVLDLFLYRSGGAPRVTYAEARARDGTGTETRPCLNGLLRRQLVAVSGASPAP